jgi:mono/diheme cytochrome c family protein
LTTVFAVSSQQRFAVAVVIVLVVGWLVYIVSSVRRGAEPGSEIETAPNRRPYLDDDALEGPKLDRSLFWALGFLGIVAIGLPLYWLREPTRQAGAGFNRGVAWFNERAIADGKRLFEIAPGDPPTPRDPHFGCAQCHGQKGEGGVATYTLTDARNPTAPPRQVQWQCPPLNTVMLRFRPEEVKSIITYGRANTPMPPWGVKGGGPMNDQQIDNLLAFLESIKLTPVQAKAQAAQYATNGKALFENYCARCHTEGFSYGEPGIAGGGAFGFALNDGRAARQFPTIEQQTDWIANTADLGKPYGAHGVSHGLMPHFANLLTDEQIRAIADYERSL